MEKLTKPVGNRTEGLRRGKRRDLRFLVLKFAPLLCEASPFLLQAQQAAGKQAMVYLPGFQGL